MIRFVLFFTFLMLSGLQAATVDVQRVEALCVRFEAPGASCMAVGDAQHLLAVGFLPEAADRLHLRRLDGRGNLTTEAPVPVALPGGAQRGYPVSLLFHPRLPLLYVWRHAVVQGSKDPVPAGFAHLVIVDLSDASAPKVVLTEAAGETFGAGALPSMMTLPADGRRLFLSNLQMNPGKGALRPAVGYLPLNPEGLPLMKDERLQVELVDTGAFQPLPNGRGFLSVDSRILLMPVTGGVVVWNTGDRRAQFGRFLLPGMQNQVGWLGGDATHFFWVPDGKNSIFSMRHADGVPTLLPMAFSAPSAVFRSVPIRVEGAVLTGGNDRLHVIGLDADGAFTGAAGEVAFPGAGPLRVMAYSPLHGRLYVPVGKEP